MFRARRLAVWELLYDRDDDWFLALSDRTPVVRYVQLPVQPRAVNVTLPLRILVIRSEPAGYPSLDLAAEWAQVAEALSELTATGAVAVTELAAPTLSELRRALMGETFPVLHYMGHGEFDPGPRHLADRLPAPGHWHDHPGAYGDHPRRDRFG
jgi:hypothetical protein